MRRTSTLIAAVAALALALAPGLAEARPGSGGSLGSRGSMTCSAPPSTSDRAVRPAPMQRSMTPSNPSPGYGIAGLWLPATAALAVHVRPDGRPDRRRHRRAAVRPRLFWHGVLGLRRVPRPPAADLPAGDGWCASCSALFRGAVAGVRRRAGMFARSGWRAGGRRDAGRRRGGGRGAQPIADRAGRLPGVRAIAAGHPGGLDRARPERAARHGDAGDG